VERQSDLNGLSEPDRPFAVCGVRAAALRRRGEGAPVLGGRPFASWDETEANLGKGPKGGRGAPS